MIPDSTIKIFRIPLHGATLASSVGNSGYNDRDESENEKRRKKSGGVACQKSKSVDRVLFPCGLVTGPRVPWGVFVRQIITSPVP